MGVCVLLGLLGLWWFDRGFIWCFVGVIVVLQGVSLLFGGFLKYLLALRFDRQPLPFARIIYFSIQGCEMWWFLSKIFWFHIQPVVPACYSPNSPPPTPPHPHLQLLEGSHQWITRNSALVSLVGTSLSAIRSQANERSLTSNAMICQANQPTSQAETPAKEVTKVCFSAVASYKAT